MEILAVRGPLTRSALRLGKTVPVGDPALLLPALHRAAGLWQRGGGQNLIVPHFHDKRSDTELLGLTGCCEVLRPNIPNDLTAISEFIDVVAAADFVLCGAMHAAIVAAAYGRPFAFWDSGDIDLPFKWLDFAASIGIPCAFHPNLTTARAHYETAVAPAIRIPVMWPLLVASPLPVRPDAFANVVAMDVARHGLAALEPDIYSRAANRLRDRLEQVTKAAEEVTAATEAVAKLQSEALAQAEDTALLEERVAVLIERLKGEELRRQDDTVRLERLETQLTETMQREARLLAEHLQLDAEKTEARVEGGRLQAEMTRLRGREATLASEEARLHEAVQARDHALAVARADVDAHAARIDAILHSTTWRLTSPLRAISRRLPWIVALLRMCWWLVTLQFGRQMN